MARPLPVLPLRDVVVFPGMVSTLFVARPASVRAVDALSVRAGRRLIVCNQKSAERVDPGPDDLHAVGTLVRIVQSVRLPDDMRKVVVEGEARVDLSNLRRIGDRLEAMPVSLPEQRDPDSERRLRLKIFDVLGELESLDGADDVSPEELEGLDAPQLADRLTASTELAIDDRQLLLETPAVDVRLEFLLRVLEMRRDRLRLDQRLKQRLQEQLERNQQQYLLGEKLRAIRSELGQDELDELDELEQRIEACDLPEQIEARALTELRRLRRMPPVSAETTVARGWLEWLLDLPWGRVRGIDLDLVAVRERLDAQHAGLDRVKERIVEYLAVQKLTGSPPATRLCLVGPPGTGKTSLARAIAEALGLDFVRQSLGGVRDEAEIRGHRRTYVGAMPGRIVQGLKRAGSMNPVFLLDEIDKMGADLRGDPASALLELLDPEQNTAFRDHYLDVDLDLSRVFFITTANSLHTIPEPLRDRLELLELSGYSESEKMTIARNHLMPRISARTGVDAAAVTLSDATLRAVIRSWTREAGVRQLEQRLETLFRRQAVAQLSGDGAPSGIDVDRLADWLGPPTRRDREDFATQRSAGTVCGLAWTTTGGEVLLTEVVRLPGRGRLEVTGKLGEIMQESVRAALTWVRVQSVALGVEGSFWRRSDLHVHLPEGAVPKDGPSAGMTVAVAMLSAVLQRSVPAAVAMTGELTLSGDILAVGGVREKLLAAERTGMSLVLLPAANAPDLTNLPQDIRTRLDVRLVGHMDEVLGLLFPELVDAPEVCDSHPAATGAELGSA